jgi:predicted nucleotidyltransferase
MAGLTIDDPILKRFRAALDHIYGNRLERVMLFGSSARGDATGESDYDVAVFIKELDLPSLERDRLADVETEILYDTGAVINAVPFSAGAYQERTGFMHELRRDGLDL